MQYGITRLVLSGAGIVPLTESEYQRAKAAKRNLFVALSIEEKLNLLLENYVEFEMELLQITTRNMLFHDSDWSSGTGELQTINRRLVNLLTACRLYIDQVKHEVSALYRDTQREERTQLEQALSAEYDGYFGYRLLEALRNYVQHRALPVHHLSLPGEVQSQHKGSLIRHTCTPSLSVREIEEDKRFKPEILAELKMGNNLVDLKPLVREYVTSICRVHRGLRERMRGDIASWEECVNGIRERYREGL